MPVNRALFVSLTNDVGSSRIVAEFGRRDVECGVLSDRDSLAAASRYATKIFALSASFGAWSLARSLRESLEAIGRDWRPDRIFPLDEMASHLLRRLVGDPKTGDALRRSLVDSLGAPEHYGATSSRGRLMRVAAQLGARQPDFRILSDWATAREAAAALGYPFVLKREYTCGGAGVSMIHDQRRFHSAYMAAALKATAKRMAMGLAGSAAAQDPPLVAQGFVAGALSMRAVACHEGEVLAGVNFVCERQHPAVTGASTIIRQLDHAEMEATAAAIVGALQCSGFAGFDFMLDANGRAHLIEMNARPIGSGHLGALFGHDLYGAYLARLRGEAPPVPAPSLAPGQAIALFPREMQRDPESPDVREGSGLLHDVPWDDPPVLAKQIAALEAAHPAKVAAIGQLLKAGRQTSADPNSARAA